MFEGFRTARHGSELAELFVATFVQTFFVVFESSFRLPIKVALRIGTSMTVGIDGELTPSNQLKSPSV